MKRVFLVLAALAWVGEPPAGAAVFQRDWKAPGDGLLTYDDVDQREWLDLSQTLLSDQFPGGPPVFPGPRERRYQYVAGQTGPGGLFEGFTVAKSQDVLALAQSARIDPTTQSFSVNSTATVALSELLSLTIPPNNRGRLTLGLLDKIRPDDATRLSFVLSTIFSSQSGMSIDGSHTEFPTRPPGVMLFRTVVPEPGTLLLALVGVLARGVLR